MKGRAHRAQVWLIPLTTLLPARQKEKQQQQAKGEGGGVVTPPPPPIKMGFPPGIPTDTLTKKTYSKIISLQQIFVFQFLNLQSSKTIERASILTYSVVTPPIPVLLRTAPSNAGAWRSNLRVAGGERQETRITHRL